MKKEKNDLNVIAEDDKSEEKNLGEELMGSNSNSLLKLLAFAVPLAGLVLYISFKSNGDMACKSYGKWAIIGLAAEIVVIAGITLYKDMYIGAA